MSPIVTEILSAYAVLAVALLLVTLPMCRQAKRGDKQLRGE